MEEWTTQYGSGPGRPPMGANPRQAALRSSQGRDHLEASETPPVEYPPVRPPSGPNNREPPVGIPDDETAGPRANPPPRPPSRRALLTPDRRSHEANAASAQTAAATEANAAAQPRPPQPLRGQRLRPTRDRLMDRPPRPTPPPAQTAAAAQANAAPTENATATPGQRRLQHRRGPTPPPRRAEPSHP